ncbi:NACHT domain-containing protein [Azospirillum sp. TSO35-2]|uniref:NACHT domain-containing protein n=1 Tax=Azospirillum sp. TSO35-2 TaxID=716796 RepID=UPI000D65EF20|nr:NACHT domain-containing protein [Azospirillum sp. TSO35-2]
MRTFTGEEFEDEVKRICRSLFSDSIGQGSEKIDGRERDGVFWNGSFFTVVEATTDKKKDKASYDAKKTHDLVAKKRSEGNMAQGYLVTLHEPTADQRAVVKKYEKTTKIISFDELRSLLFDAAGYLRIRSEKPFGSVYNHVSHTFEVPRSEFVAPTITRARTGEIVSVDHISQVVQHSARMIITAEYGIGKSMLLREVYFSLLKEFSQNNSFRFPIAINLREHLGQSDPVELLERHARNNAADPRRLVAAWSAGYVDLIIDGFDELSTRGWTGDHRKLREFKRNTHAVVKNLIKQTPSKSSIIIAGRVAYFDSDSEMREALGAPDGLFDHFLIQPFDSDQAAEFLSRKGRDDPLPQWLPTRPLFLSYLINKNLIKEAVTISSHGSFPEGAAWSALLGMIASRESEQSEGVDKDAILQFWGLLATKARQGNAIQKSFSPKEMDEVFHEATGNTVSEEERRVLLRLPGLGISPNDASNRTFIDVDFLNAASANLVISHIRYPYGDEAYRADLRSIAQQLNQVGTHVVCSMIETEGISPGLLSACLSKEIDEGNYALAFDLFFPAIFLGESQKYMKFEGLDIEELDICQEVWDSIRVKFCNCLISNLVLPPDGPLPLDLQFVDCLIGNIDGRSSERDLPERSFVNCEVGNFSSSYSVNNEVLGSELPIGVRVLVVTLRKVYAQSGISRLESALLRGLDHRSRMIAPDVIEYLRKHGFLVESGRQGKTIYAGTRSMRKDALAIIQSPATHQAPVLDACRKLS